MSVIPSGRQRRWGWTPALAAAGLLAAAQAFAQPAEPPALQPRRVVVGGGVAWAGRYAIGDTAADLRGNAVGSTPPTVTLFRAASRVQASAGVEVRVSYALSRMIAIEVDGTASRPTIGTAFSGDAEATAVRIDADRLQQLGIEGGLTWQLPLRMGTRLAPFASGGGGYLRQLHEERTLAETGSTWFAGGGARYWIRGGHGSGRPLGLRGDLRVVWRRHGVDFAPRVRAFPAASVSLFVGL